MYEFMMRALPDRAWDVYCWLTNDKGCRSKRSLREHLRRKAMIRRAMWGDR